LVERLTGAYRFVHDRIQEAAYSLIPEEQRGEMHLRIGRLLAALMTPEKREAAIFDIVNQLNRGSHLITSAEERKRVAEWDLSAGRRAKISTAYTSALSYLGAARALLTEESWDENYELIFSIEYDTAECELLTADMVAAENRLLMLAQRAKGGHDIAVVTRLRLTLYTTLDRSNRAVEVCLEYLRRGGTDWSPHPTSDEVQREYDQIWSQVGSRQIEDLIDLPLMTNPDVLDALDVLGEVVTPALFCDEHLSSLVICRTVNLSLEHGNSDGSCFAYVWFAIIAGPRFGNYKDGFRFGRLGYDLVEKRGLKRFQARTYMSFGDIVLPWTKHVRAGRDLVRRAFDAANEIGDVTFAGYCCDHLTKNMLAAGDQLVEVQREAENGLQFAQKVRFGLVVDHIKAQLSLIRTLRGLTPKFGSFNDDQFDELRFERYLASNPALAELECWYWVRKLQARFFAGDYASAVDASLSAQRQLWTSPSQFETAELCFYGALSHAASWDSASPDEKQKHFEALAAHYRQLELWAENCPENFENRAALVGAEIARIEGRELDAERLYEQAIRSARANGFVHNEAIAYERASTFYRARGLDQFAELYLRNARYGYLRWGADGKVQQLDEMYPHLRTVELAPDPTTTIGAPVEHLDLATVINVSQAVSGEIVLEKLLHTLMRAAIEQAGAEHGLLIMARGAEPRIAAEATIGGDAVTVQLRDEPVTAAMLPESVLHYVLLTQESVILDDASAQNPFSADPYIRQRQARSVLWLPLLNQPKLIGVLYLENNLTPRVFAPARIPVLKLLASQAAISLENTRLYRDLAEREAKIRRLVDANIIGIFIWELEGRIIEANDAFLHLVGYDREDLVSGRVRWTDLTPAEWRERDERAVAELKATATVQPYEKEFFRKDGSRVPVLIGAAIYEGSRNEGVAFLLDLSEQKRAEERVVKNEERTRLMLDEALDAVVTMDADGVTTGWNTQAEVIFGWSREDAVGRRMSDTIIPAQHREAHERGLRHFLATGEGAVLNRRIEMTALRRDGREFPIELAITPLKLGQTWTFSAFIRDISERKRAEEALHQAQADLTHVTRLLTMGELTASIAHEVNQPLAGVTTNSNAALRWLARNPPDLEEVRACLQRIVRDGTRAGEVIARMRAFAGKAAPQIAPLALHDVIAEVLALADGELRRHGVVLHTDLAADLPPVRADRIQLQQVLLNLLLNGMDAMRSVTDRPRALIVRAQPEEDAAIRVAVEDAGVGIAPQDLERMFTPFFTTKPEGMGMGLAISRSIVEAHGGRLWATPNVGPGATVQFTLPLPSAPQA
jgi:PAS domain S-box-containing protein